MSKEHLLEEGHVDPQTEEAMRLQNPQLKLLHASGVAQMIEQKVGIEIPPLVFEDDPNQPPKVDFMHSLQMGLPDGHFSFSGKWMLISVPSPTEKGVFDTTLRITAFRFTNQRPKDEDRSRFTHDTQSVFIEFSQDKDLKVAGDKTTFEGNLATIDNQLLARVQAGINEAFTKPETKLGGEMGVMGSITPRQTSRVG